MVSRILALVFIYLSTLHPFPVVHVHRLSSMKKFTYSGYTDGSLYTRLYLYFLTQTEESQKTTFTLGLKELNIEEHHERTFSKNSWFENWKIRSLTLKNLQQLSSLTFHCTMKSIETIKNIEDIPLLFQQDSAADSQKIDTKLSWPLCSTVPSIMGTYTWSIDDLLTIKKMSAAPNVHGFSSPIFEMHGFKWYLTVYPNGSKTDRKGKVNLNLNLASVPDMYMDVMVRQRLHFNHKSVEYLTTYNYERTSLRGIPFGDDEYSTEEMEGMKWLCFTAEIELIETRLMHNKKGDIQSIQSKDVRNDVSIPIYLGGDHELLQQYASTIELEEDSDEVFLWSKTFVFYGLVWCLLMDDAEKKVSLCLKDLKDRDLVRDHILCIRFVVSLPDFGTRVISSGYFGQGNIVNDWGNSKVNWTQSDGVVSVELEMEMIDIISTIKDETVKEWFDKV